MWITGDKQNLSQVNKVSIFKPHISKVFLGQNTGGQSVIFPYIFTIFG